MGPTMAIGTNTSSSGATGTFGMVAMSKATNTIANNPPVATMLMASAPAQYPCSRSKCRPQRGQAGAIFR